MTHGRFERLRKLFEDALAQPPSQRGEFLDAACSGDPDLRREVASLLVAHDSTTRVIEEGVSAWGVEGSIFSSRQGGRIGPYEVLREIGRGGMGTVYLARRADEAFQRMVAIKVLRADIANADLLRRFQREREILASFDHPHVTRLLDAGTTEEGLPYFVMEYVEGKSLLDYSDDERLSVSDRLRLYRQVCDAVAYAHRQGVVHRDLKPSNILVSRGIVKVLDFGIARIVRGEAPDETLTAASMLMMTPQYASPEQVRGEPVTRQSDVYALGVVLYELLTGHSPYHLRSRVLHEVIRVVCEENPTRPSAVIATPIDLDVGDKKPGVTVMPETAGRLRQVSMEQWRGALRGDLDAILLKALAKHPSDRYCSPEQLNEDLERHLKQEPVRARDTAWWHRVLALISRYRVSVTSGVAITAAILTGAINLHLSVLYYVVGTVLLCCLWYAAADREFGRKVAASSLTNPLVAVPMVLAALLVLNLLSRGRPAPVWVRDTAVVAAILFGISYFSAWLLRGLWTGSRVLDFSQTDRSRNLQAIALLLAPWVISSGSMTRLPWEEGMLLSVATLLRGRKEIRQAGILIGGHLIRWRSIRGWSWETEENLILRAGMFRSSLLDLSRVISHPGEYVVLKLDLHRRVQFLGPKLIRVNLQQRTDIEPVLTRYLGNWPG